MESIFNITPNNISSRLDLKAHINKIIPAILVISVVAGGITGYSLAKKSGAGAGVLSIIEKPKSAQQDTRTFKDFAEGTIKVKPKPKNPSEYTEGTHTLIREDDPQHPVALTSSVVDLSEYENKKVKIYGETQKALKEGWLMDVGRVEEIK